MLTFNLLSNYNIEIMLLNSLVFDIHLRGTRRGVLALFSGKAFFIKMQNQCYSVYTKLQLRH